MSRFRLLGAALPALLIGLSATSATAQDSSPCYDVDFSVELGASFPGTVNICSDVYENPGPTSPFAKTILAVHGYSETGDTWGPLKDELFAHPILRFGVERIIAINLPNRGGSGNVMFDPGVPLLFQDLAIENYAEMVIGVIEALEADGVDLDLVLAHSQGGLLVQSVQEMLLADGSSLAAHGIHQAVTLAAVPNSAIEDFDANFPPPLLPSEDPVATAMLGVHIRPDPLTGQAYGFGKTSAGVFDTDPPNEVFFPVDIVCFDGVVNPPECIGTVPAEFIGPEPLRATLQLAGMTAPNPPFPDGYVPATRPFARQRAFSPGKGTLLQVIGFEEDMLTPAVSSLPGLEGRNFQREMYVYLTGDPFGIGYRTVDTPDSVHSMHITNPGGMIDDLGFFSLIVF